jgi:predicted enzyme related to lactoylglutathione lyase
MSQVNEYPPGTFCWVELGTSDAAAAKKFYAELFGWSFNDQPVGPDLVYTLLQLEEKDVAALYQLNKELTEQRVPPHWLSYVSVSSADETAGKTGGLGGKVLKEPFDVFDLGRMAVLQDPTGATFAVWQPRTHPGALLVNQPGTLCWNELITADVAAAGKFYTALFGWTAESQQMGPVNYTSFMNGERPAGGMIAISKEMGEVPPYWLVYFAVADCDQTVGKTTSLGGTITAPALDVPGVGRLAVAQDPQGAFFAFIRLENPA